MLYSGHARTFAHLVENHWFRVLRRLPAPTVFASVVDDPQAEDLRLLTRFLSWEKLVFEKVTQPQIPEPPVTSKFHAGYPVTASPQAILRQLWHLGRVWDFFQEKKAYDFDIIVRIRPDSCFFGDLNLSSLLRKSATIPSSNEMPKNDVFTPWWARWGGINDRFAIMGPNAADSYFSVFESRNYLFQQGCPLHPETMLNTHLRAQGVRVHTNLKLEFAPLRMPDERHPEPWLDQLQISPIDLADYRAA